MNASCRNTRIDLGTPAAAPEASSTRTTNENVPTVVGLPVVLPPDESNTPGGSAPSLIDHLYGFTPPAAPSATVAYVTPTSPVWKGTVVMISFGGLGDAFGVGDVAGVGVFAGVGEVLGVGLASSVEGVVAGEFVCWLVG
jgi:hypothetical protein